METTQTANAITKLGGILAQVATILEPETLYTIVQPKVESELKEALKNIKPQVKTIDVHVAEKVTKIEGLVHEEFATVLDLVANYEPVYLSGAAGTGKNVICEQIAKALGLEFYFANAVQNTFELTGFVDANGIYQETEFYRAVTHGGVFMLDEMDASVPEALIILNAVLSNGYFVFPKVGKVIVHKDLHIVAAGNTLGTGGDATYTGRSTIDGATLNRFAKIHIDYSPAIEEAIAGEDTDAVEYIRAFRKSINEAGLSYVCTYRDLNRLVKLSRLWGNAAKAVKVAVLNGIDSSDVECILSRMEIKRINKYYKASI